MAERRALTTEVQPWVEAATGLFVTSRFRAISGDPEALYLRLLTTARSQFAAGLAYERLTAIEGALPMRGLEGVERVLTLASDAHSFVVASALFWSTLGEVVRQVKTPDLRAVFDGHNGASAAAKRARDHIEHL